MRLRLLNEIVESKYSEYVDKAIAEVKSLGPQSGDERYKNVWEEFAAQIQVQHSVFFDAYEDAIRRICLGIVEHLPRRRYDFFGFGLMRSWKASMALLLAFRIWFIMFSRRSIVESAVGRQMRIARRGRSTRLIVSSAMTKCSVPSRN